MSDDSKPTQDEMEQADLGCWLILYGGSILLGFLVYWLFFNH